jgi:DinB superfamily
VTLPGKLQQLWDGMEANRAITLGMVGALPPDTFVRREEGEWSIAQLLEHMVLAETGTSKLIRKLLKEKAGSLPPYPEDDSVLAVRPAGPAGERQTKAPEVAHPKSDAGKEEILSLAASTRAATRVSLEMLAGADPRCLEYPHPFFGVMNVYEWLCRIVLEHERQHHPQIREILRTLGTR